MVQRTVESQPELNGEGFEDEDSRRRHERAELLRRAGVRPARGSMYRPERVTVRPYPRWLLFFVRLFR
jgi:hypothetical protein